MRRVGPYELVESRPVYRNPWISVREDRVVRPDGVESSFGIVEMKAGATVLAVTGDGDAVLVREFKYGVGRETLEAISGGIEPGESPAEAARRELREEAGYEASEWTDLGVIDPFTTVIHSPNYVYLARGLEAVERAPDAGEFVETVRVRFEQAFEMALRSEITHGATVVALLKAARRLDIDRSRTGS
jgi:ADP-ribose pyrophosphatase